jgi:hypothetical protein
MALACTRNCFDALEATVDDPFDGLGCGWFGAESALLSSYARPDRHVGFFRQNCPGMTNESPFVGLVFFIAITAVQLSDSSVYIPERATMILVRPSLVP